MPNIRFRMYYNNNPATLEQLDVVEDITIEQEIDMAWEARVRIPVQVDDKGKWRKEDEDFMKPFARVRVEVAVYSDVFVPLIDGPIVKRDGDKNPEPGQSWITLTVHDDSVYLNREERVLRFDGMSDHEAAAELFSQAEQIVSTDIDNTPAPAGSLAPAVFQRGTAMHALRQLAQRHEMHAYVLPGDQPGESIGCFKKFVLDPSGLPPLILLGREKNVVKFDIANDAQKPAEVKAFALDVTDKAVRSAESRFESLDLLGAEQASQSGTGGQAATKIAAPGLESSVDVDQRVAVQAEKASYAFEATGTLQTECYGAVLQPYLVVTALGLNDRLSGDFLIKSVTHTLTRSQYSQSFKLMRNAVSEGLAGKSVDPAGRIF